MKFSKRFHVKPGRTVKLHEMDASDTFGFEKESAHAKTEGNAQLLNSYHDLLFAENKRAVLVVLQGMDTSGKDGVIRHAMQGLNPQGCVVTPFKAPVGDELRHDFLWRIHKAAPPKGSVGIFNRSQYEDVLVPRVRGWISKHEWKARYKQINHFEKMLTDNDVTILKFFLHISKDEQKERLQARLDDSKKNWKFSENDLKERKLWHDYMDAYEDLLSACSTDHAPWYVIPSDKKWFRNLAVSEILNEQMEKMKLEYPPPRLDLRKIKIV